MSMSIRVCAQRLRSLAIPLRASSSYKSTPSSKTHTGQAWESDDARNARFVDRQKEFNRSFAKDLINEAPIIKVHGRKAECNGGGGALGHPKVYINLDVSRPVSCNYCGIRFQQVHDH